MQYDFGRVLGKGAFGKVAIARLRTDHSKVYAIKSLLREMFHSDNQKLDKDTMRSLLETEIKVVM